jgi:uncharacterized protein (DUF1330 family)
LIYITQLIYIVPGQELVFNEFERMAIPVISKYNGRLLLRIKPGHVIEANIEVPYEIHLVQFETAEDFERFKQDEGRKAFLHLKEKSVRETLLITGS